MIFRIFFVDKCSYCFIKLLIVYINTYNTQIFSYLPMSGWLTFFGNEHTILVYRHFVHSNFFIFFAVTP